jgi:hypothetical protein
MIDLEQRVELAIEHGEKAYHAYPLNAQQR